MEQRLREREKQPCRIFKHFTISVSGSDIWNRSLKQRTVEESTTGARRSVNHAEEGLDTTQPMDTFIQDQTSVPDITLKGLKIIYHRNF
jgi:hypothetical protein